MTRIVIVGGKRRRHQCRAACPGARPTSPVDVIVADTYPNFSICGIPYYISGDVADWRRLAHRSITDLEATGMRLHLETVARPDQCRGSHARDC